jgi:hypothetical protein
VLAKKKHWSPARVTTNGLVWIGLNVASRQGCSTSDYPTRFPCLDDDVTQKIPGNIGIVSKRNMVNKENI